MNKQSWFSCNCLIVWALLALLTASPRVQADSLWRDDGPRTMFNDKRAYTVGDILTVVVYETSSANKDNSTTTERTSKINSSVSTLLYPPASNPMMISKFIAPNGENPVMAIDGHTKHAGTGVIKNSETISAKITVRVVDVMPNGNLVVQGSRHTEAANESQDIIVRGILRAEDIASDNTVSSAYLADASVKIVGKGTVSDTTKKGWLMKFWDKLTPF